MHFNILEVVREKKMSANLESVVCKAVYLDGMRSFDLQRLGQIESHGFCACVCVCVHPSLSRVNLASPSSAVPSSGKTEVAGVLRDEAVDTACEGALSSLL